MASLNWSPFIHDAMKLQALGCKDILIGIDHWCHIKIYVPFSLWHIKIMYSIKFQSHKCIKYNFKTWWGLVKFVYIYKVDNPCSFTFPIIYGTYIWVVRTWFGMAFMMDIKRTCVYERDWIKCSNMITIIVSIVNKIIGGGGGRWWWEPSFQ